MTYRTPPRIAPREFNTCTNCGVRTGIKCLRCGQPVCSSCMGSHPRLPAEAREQWDPFGDERCKGGVL